MHGAPEKFGWELLTEALREARFDLITCVAGKPVTPTQDALVAAGEARWVNHEAAAAQMALGASGVGQRAAVVLKQVGMNAALDVLACAAPHRSGGAMVVIVGDDPGSVFSQIEGDSRQLAAAAELPCFEPAGPADIANALFEALRVSISTNVPAVLRVTSPLLLESKAPALAPGARDLPSTAPFDPSFWKVDFVAHRQQLLEALDGLPEDGTHWTRAGETPVRVVASGLPAAEAIAMTDLDVLALRRVVPAPREALAAFAAQSDAPLLVLEESGPCVEDQLRAVAPERTVLGRRTGHVAWAGPISVAASLATAEAGKPLTPPAPTPNPGDPDADLSPFGSLWRDAEELGLTPIAVDAGHCWAGVFLEGDPAPFCYGLGSATGVAAGIALARGGPAIAVTGDMGAFHAGLVGLLQAVRDRIPVITFVEDDGAATTTGGQPTPSAPALDGEREVSFEAIARAIGVDHVETVSKDRMTSQFLRPKLEALTQLEGPSVVIIDEKASA